MTIAFTGKGDAANLTGTATPTYTSFTVAAGEGVAIVVVCGSGQTTTGVSDGTNTYAQVGAAATDSSDGFKFSIWYKANVSAVTGGTLTVTNNSSGGNNAVIWSRLTGLDLTAVGQAAPAYNRNVGPGTGTDAVTTASISATAQPACLVGFAINLQGGVTNAGTGFTDDGNFVNLPSSGFAWQGRIQHRALTDTTGHFSTNTLTGGTNNVVSLAVALAQPSAGNVYVAQEAQSTGSSGTSVNLAFASNETAGNSNHVVVRALTSTSFTVTDTQGNTYTQQGSTLNDGAGGHFMAQFTCDNVSSAANTITVACSPSGTGINVWIREISNTAGFDTHVEQIQAGIGNSTADAITTGLANPGFSPGMVSGFTNITIANPPALSAGSGYTSDGSPWGAGNSISQHQRYVAANAIASTTTASTTNSTNAFSFAALFKEVGALAGKSLTGQTATYSQGPGSRSVSYAPTAQTIISTEGAITESMAITLGGQTATFGEGNLLNSINLTGQTATFAAGTLTKFVSGDVTTSLSGISASFSEGNLSLSLGYILDSNLIVMVGQTATFAQGQITATVSPAITAQTITSTEGSISAGTSSGPTYTLGSLSAVFAQGNITASVAGNVSTQLLGQTATFSEGSLVDAYSYSVTGLTLTSTEGVITFSVSGDVAFQINGQTATFSEGLMALAFPGGMPNLIGLNYYEALLVMQQAGVYAPQKIGYFGTFPITARWIPSVQPPETVLAQSVAAGTTFKVNMPITLTLSEFPVSVALP